MRRPRMVTVTVVTIRDGLAMVSRSAALALGTAELAQLVIDIGELGAQGLMLFAAEHAAANVMGASRVARIIRAWRCRFTPSVISAPAAAFKPAGANVRRF